MKRLLRTLAIAGWALLLACGPATAQISPRVAAKEVTRGELALLPEWCIDSQDGPYGSPEGGEYINKSPRAREWVGLMGRDFWHMHHYCRGLRDLIRLSGGVLNPRERTFLLGRAVDEFNYVIDNCQASMPLLPEVFLKRGEIQSQQGDLVNAMDSFDAARKLKPDYWPAYERWVVLLVGLKQYERAAALVDEALAASPDQPNLVAQRKAIQAAQRAPQRPVRAVAAASSGAAR